MNLAKQEVRNHIDVTRYVTALAYELLNDELAMCRAVKPMIVETVRTPTIQLNEIALIKAKGKRARKVGKRTEMALDGYFCTANGTATRNSGSSKVPPLVLDSNIEQIAGIYERGRDQWLSSFDDRKELIIHKEVLFGLYKHKMRIPVLALRKKISKQLIIDINNKARAYFE